MEFTEEDKEEAKDNLQPIVCPRCKTKNLYDAKYCMTCSMILDSRLVQDVDTSKDNAADALTKMLSDPEKMAKFAALLADDGGD